MITLALSAALAAEPTSDPYVDALAAELSRQMSGLTLGDAPPLYHLRYHLLNVDQIDVEASRGAVVRHSTDPFNALGVEVRVGSPEFDNTGFGGWQDGLDATGLPVALTERSLQVRTWLVTDRAYKSAVEQYARKVSQFDAPDDYPGNFTLTGPSIVTRPVPKIGDPAPLVALARDASAAMALDATVERAEVYIGHEAGSRWVIDSEGTRARLPIAETSVSSVVHVRAPDGQLLTDRRLWCVRGPEDLPPADEIVAASRAMAEDLRALAGVAPLDDEYVGPVLFQGDAARDLFRYLLVPQLEGTPTDIPFDTMFGDLAASGGDVRVGRRVLPAGWSVVDDPTRAPDHPSSMTEDLEGTPTQGVAVAIDGVLTEPLMSRVPRDEIKTSNGHARGGLGDRLRGRVMQLTVEPDRHRSEKKLVRTGLRLAAQYGNDHLLVVRSLQEPAVMDLGEASFILFGGSSDADAGLPPPVAMWRVYADGREELVRGAAFAGVERWLLRDIVAAGPSSAGTFMASPDPGRNTHSPTEGMPTWISAPDVLVGEVELIPRPADPRALPLIPAPEPARGGAND
jgi:hypothetical protein